MNSRMLVSVLGSQNKSASCGLAANLDLYKLYFAYQEIHEVYNQIIYLLRGAHYYHPKHPIYHLEMSKVKYIPKMQFVPSPYYNANLYFLLYTIIHVSYIAWYESQVVNLNAIDTKCIHIYTHTSHITYNKTCIVTTLLQCPSIDVSYTFHYMFHIIFAILY